MFILGSKVHHTFFTKYLYTIIVLKKNTFSPLSHRDVAHFLLFKENPVISTRFSHTFFTEHVFSIFPIGFPVHTDKLYHKPISLSVQPLQLPKATDLTPLSETASTGIQKDTGDKPS